MSRNVMKLRHVCSLASAVAITLGVTSTAAAPPAKSPAERIDDAAILANEKQGNDWLSYNLGYHEQRYSPLHQINRDTVGRLGLAWTYALDTERGVEASPIVVDGVMYVTGPWSVVHAVDARSGRRLWTYDPQVPRSYGAWACCDVVNRGVAVYKGRLFVGTLDGYLLALDAASGRLLWRVDTNLDRSKYKHTITGAPRVFADTVLIGHGGAELSALGYVSAYDAASGRLKWRWFSVPRRARAPFDDPSQAAAARTWDPSGAWTEVGGGGTIWDAIVYDPELQRVYLGVGNGLPWNREVRSPRDGDNLYVASIVALDARDGHYLWHYQPTPGDAWDYDAAEHLILADFQIDGRKRQVLLQANKNGFFFVIDRRDGRLLSAQNFVPVTWAKGYDQRGRPIEVEDARARLKPWETVPSAYGAHNWQPMSYNPDTGLVYIPAQGVPLAIAQDPDWKANRGIPGRPMSNLGWNLGYLLNTIAPQASAFGRLIAWDPVAQREAWHQDLGAPWNGGTLTTAGGLVFQGTADGRFVAYDARDGRQLWQTEVGSGVIAAPVTYAIDGEQYVALAVGWGGVFGLAQHATERLSPGRVYVYKLGGDAPAPAVRSIASFRRTTLVSGVSYRKEDVAEGGALYLANCLFCHGVPAVNNGGALPNLAYSDPQVLAHLPDLVLGDAYVPRGMPEFRDRLDKSQVEKIAAFVLNMAETASPH
ncbi:MAG: PQQ-dependent dehydrogenase, methanol/ethanol family [Sinobacteraceae bacterium]|nr:PQQ-dependent dehydrogenase, methanol/ethanol family [Nevskiaceae bacterium]